MTVKLYWHPRSGGQWACAMVKRVFYPELYEPQYPGSTGHWAKRRASPPWPGRVLSGGHGFYSGQKDCIYLVRDGRDVAASFYRTKAFHHPSLDGISFSDLLRWPLDWRGTPGQRWQAGPDSIVDHWLSHVMHWSEREGVHYVRYEELLLEPEQTLVDIGKFLGREPDLGASLITAPTGNFPAKSFRTGKWKEVFSDDDLEYFFSIVPQGFWALWGES